MLPSQLRIVFTVLVVMSIAACDGGSGGAGTQKESSQRDVFERELKEKLKALEATLRDFGAGCSAYSIEKRSEAVIEHFARVRYPLAISLASRREDDTEWLERIKSDLATSRAAVVKRLAEIKDAFEKNPGQYKYSDIGSSVYSYSTVRIDQNQVIFMIDTSQGFSCLTRLEIDVDKWRDSFVKGSVTRPSTGIATRPGE
jgi:hypothetical protein